MPRVILTYGTFDLFHVGHLNLLRRARGLGDRLIVGVSTDEFNSQKGKQTIINFNDRMNIVRSIRYVDDTFPESSWDQKVADVRKYDVDTFVMGDDWTGKFDFLKDWCKVVYFPRTVGVSSTNMKLLLRYFDSSHIEELKKALDMTSAIAERFN